MTRAKAILFFVALYTILVANCMNNSVGKLPNRYYQVGFANLQTFSNSQMRYHAESKQLGSNSPYVLLDAVQLDIETCFGTLDASRGSVAASEE